MDIETFIAKWLGTQGGAERANFPIFMSEFCRALGLPEPGQAIGGILSDYQYEAPVRPDAAFSSKASGRIDLYRRRSFVLEAKQSRLGEIAAAGPPAAPAPITGFNLFGETVVVGTTSVAKRVPRRYDRLMEEALAQAKGYALALPPDHGWPPFLIVCDVGRAFEIYFDWAGNGKGYGFFPDQASYRIDLTDLRLPQKQDLLRDIWLRPASVDPRLRAVEVTRDIASRLARVSAYLEEREKKANPDVADWERSRGIEETSLFLMRILFCMFAEDVELLPKGKFEKFLAEAVNGSERMWTHGLTELWTLMGKPGLPERWWQLADTVVKYFNGNLFTDFRIYWLPPEMKGELLAAARREWKNVEPAIFGTLLEQALTTGEREKLGAHYTPRPYVERLVEWTIMDVLRAEWDAVRHPAEGTPNLADAQPFHARLAALAILDPACGTGNFLYVAMEQLLRLESEVIVLITQLGGEAKPAIGPGQFLGLELNPRAATIAELVLWIGWLRFRLANDPDSIAEPVLPPLSNINFGRHGGYDAVLAGNPATGEIADLANPRPAEWPAADFIVGNPPFIGKGAAMRGALGSDYVEGIWRAYPQMPGSADFVMFWWSKSATALTIPESRLIRFGLVTTNSITGSFNRRVIEAALGAEQPVSIVCAMPDHPWTSVGKGAAAVRIAMTVGQAGKQEGQLFHVLSETGLNTDNPAIEVSGVIGRINADLSIGMDGTTARPLVSNTGIAATGMLLAGKGFKVSRSFAAELIARDGPTAEQVVRPYVGGGEVLGLARHRSVIDFHGLTERQARTEFPATYSHVLTTVKPERDQNPQPSRRDQWWLFGRRNTALRAAIAGCRRYIGTTETAKHRIFQFIDAKTVPDHMVITIALEDAFHIGILSSQAHLEWVYDRCSLLGVATFEQGHRYNKTVCFDPFPFPDPTPAQRAVIAELGEEIDATRKTVQAEHPDITLTGLYNLVEKLRAGAVLPVAEADTARRARAAIILELHRRLDAAVAAAYGWPADLAPAEIVARLVALNAERAAEEAAGKIRWLRPDYQARAK